MPQYFPTTVPTSERIDQLQRWLRAEFGFVQQSTDDIYFLADRVLQLFTIAAYGGIGLDAETALGTVNTTFETLPFDVELIPNPRGLTYALGSNAMRFDEVGVWRMNAKVSLQFTEVNQSRRIQLRLFNVTTNTPASTVFNFAVGRNTDGVNLNFNLLVAVDETVAGDVYVLQVGTSGDTFSNVNAIGSIWDANHVAEYQGDFFERAAQENRE